MARKFNVGDTVKIVGLQTWKQYVSRNGERTETATPSMIKYSNKKAKIVEITGDDKYRLDIDPLYIYVDSMFELVEKANGVEIAVDLDLDMAITAKDLNQKVKAVKKDKVSAMPYKSNKEVEDLLKHVKKDHLLKLIDEALDNGDKEAFMRLTDELNS